MFLGNPGIVCRDAAPTREFPKKIMNAAQLFSVLFGVLSLAACSAGDEGKTMETKSEKPADPTGKVEKTDAEWKKETHSRAV